MGALAMPFETLPLGFRFKPTDVELIDHYLRLKINGKEDEVACIKEVDICRVEPWDLPDLSAIKTNDHEWFYFCPRDRKYPNGQRSNRATEKGYWKATGKDRTIKSRKMGLIGMKKTLVFYTGRAPKGKRTHWVIHEYRTTLQELDGSHPGQGAFVLCRLFKKADDIKQDDADDASHSDGVDTSILSPNPTNVSHDEIRSEPGVLQASPLSVEQSVEQTEHCAVKTSDSMTSETMYPDHPPMNEEMTHEADSHFNEPILFDYPSQPYFKWQSVQADQGPIGMDDIFAAPTDFGDSCYYGYNLQDIDGRGGPDSDFLSSVINPDGSICKEANYQEVPFVQSIKETGSCSGGSDVEVGQQQHEAAYICSITSDKSYNEPKGEQERLQNNPPLVDDDSIFSDYSLFNFCHAELASPSYYDTPPLNNIVKTEDGQLLGHNGIKLRSNIGDRQLLPSMVPCQGEARRRLRLDLKMDQGKGTHSIVTDRSCAPIIRSDSPDPYSATVNSPEDFLCIEDLDKDLSTDVRKDEVVETTGIKIKHLRQRTRPNPVKSVEQGSAQRRIRLLKVPSIKVKADVAKPLVAESRSLSKEAGEKQCAEPPSDGEPDQTSSSSSVKRSVIRPLVQSNPVKSVEQRSAPRRIRLEVADVAKPLVSELRSLSKEAGEKQCAEPPSDGGPDQTSSSSSVKRSVSVNMVNLVMVVFMFIACIGFWIARSDYVISS